MIFTHALIDRDKIYLVKDPVLRGRFYHASHYDYLGSAAGQTTTTPHQYERAGAFPADTSTLVSLVTA